MSSTRSFAALAVSASLLGDPLIASDPIAAPFRSAFEAQFPKSEATAAALELEKLAAALGIDLVPTPDSGPPGSRGSSSGVARLSPQQPSRPSNDEAAAYRPIAAAVSEFLERELKSSEEKIGRPPGTVDRFLSERDAAIASIESVLLRGAEIQWEVDVSRGQSGTLPNTRGLFGVKRLLSARALVEARRGETDRAIQTLEASWRLTEALSRRPEFLADLLVVSCAKLDAGTVRKIDSPAYGWTDRLRSASIPSAFYAAFQNQVWYSPFSGDDLSGKGGTYGRVLRQIAEEIQRMDVCDWTPEKLDEAWSRSFLEQDPDNPAGLPGPNMMESFQRLRRYLVEAELTALILDARAERAASREHAWPEKLSTLGRGVCGGAAWSYRPSAKGTATIAFEGHLVERESRALQLPMTFTAGTPATPTPRPSPRPTRRPKR